MAMDFSKFSKAMEEAFQQLKLITEQDKAEKIFAQKLTKALHELLSSAEVTIDVLPLEIAVQGSATAQSNINAIQLKGNDSIHGGGIK